ncbi:MAG: hypothetical protein AB1861_12785 [Cyanobacteriota bacterium]
MLVFFIHGVATRTNEYANELTNKIKEDFSKRNQSAPLFYSSLWGGVLKNTPNLWGWVQQDLNDFQRTHQIDVGNVFQYSKYREFFVTHFFGDLFTYLNLDYGWEIRKVIALQLLECLEKYPNENELHIVAHSLGGVILWDILFSDKFESNAPAFYIRSVIKGLAGAKDSHQVTLGSITTMGTPILLFNLMLGISPENLKLFASKYRDKPLRWVNIIRSSDPLAYPIRASFNIDLPSQLFLRDRYIGSRTLWKKSAPYISALGGLAIAHGLERSHTCYWRKSRVSRLITANILGDYAAIDSANPFKLDWF